MFSIENNKKETNNTYFHYSFLIVHILKLVRMEKKYSIEI